MVATHWHNGSKISQQQLRWQRIEMSTLELKAKERNKTAVSYISFEIDGNHD